MQQSDLDGLSTDGDAVAADPEPSRSRTGWLLALFALGCGFIGQWRLALQPEGKAFEQHEFNPSILGSLPWFALAGLSFALLMLRRERPALWQRLGGVRRRLPWLFAGSRPYLVISLLCAALTIILIIAHEQANELFYWDAVLLWVTSMAAYLLAFAWPNLAWWRARWQAYRREILAVLALTLVAALLRFVHLESMPDIMNGDEGLHSNDARSIAEGKYGHPFATFWGSGTFYLFFVALWERLLDYSLLATRIMPAIGGTLGVPATYLLARRLFDPRVAFVAAGLVAFLHVHIHFSRVLGVGYINVTLFASLGVYLLYSALENQSLRRAALGGIILGSWVYVYVDSRFVPPVLILWLAVMAILPRHRRFVLRNWRVLSLFIVGYLLAAAPMILWGIRHPNEFNERFNDNSTVAQMYFEGRGDLVTFMLNQWAHAFLTITYHPLEFFYDATVPQLDLLTGSVFWLAIAYALLRIFDRRFLLLNIWFWAGVTVVGLFTFPRSSDGYRLLTAFVPMVIMIAVVVVALATALSRALRASPRMVWGGIGAFLGAVFLINANIYFGEFRRSCRYGDLQPAGPARTAYYLGMVLHGMQPEQKVIYLGTQGFVYGTHASTLYLNPGVEVETWRDPLSPSALTGSAPHAFVVHNSRYTDLAKLQTSYPGGTLTEIKDCGIPALYTYAFSVPPEVSTTDAPLVDLGSINVETSPLDMGSWMELFDHDSETLIRGSTNVNPVVLDMTFLTPRTMQQIELTVGTMDFQVDAEMTTVDGTSQSFSQTYTGLDADPTVQLPLPTGPAQISRLRLSILQLQAPPEVNIHIRELAFY